MSAPKQYNGHHCWNCWNVALWIGNDEGLYRAALECKARPHNRRNGPPNASTAARRFLELVGDRARTPDGALYTFKAVRAAFVGLE